MCVFLCLQDLVVNIIMIGEYLLNYNWGFCFWFIVWDNYGFGIGISFDDCMFNVIEQAGLFCVFIQNIFEIWEVGSLQIVEWDVVNINVFFVVVIGVDIFFFVDGGFIYFYQLVVGVFNDGVVFIIVLDMFFGIVFWYKIKVVNNVFFDINNVNIIIEVVIVFGLALGMENVEVEVCVGEIVVYMVQV